MDSSDGGSDTLAQIRRGGYVFYMSDGTRFRRLDVEPVKIRNTDMKGSSRLSVVVNRKRKYQSEEDCDDRVEHPDDEWFCRSDLHVCCDDEAGPATRIHLGEKCASWLTLSDDQKWALSLLRARAATDTDGGNGFFTCAIIEGPGGCGKTRLMAHIMNHSHVNTLVIYVTKQNKRVQDFVHADCLHGEPDRSVQKPFDLTATTAREIRNIVERANEVGRYAVTAEKLVYALSGLPPYSFNRDATPTSLSIDYRQIRGVQPQAERPVGAFNTAPASGRHLIVLMDEYTMLQPPLIHAIVYYLRKLSNAPVTLVMGGDQHQCGPIGWNVTDVAARLDGGRYTPDVREEFVTKMGYAPLELIMQNMLRCRGDPALAVCVKRLRRVCSEYPSQSTRAAVNRVLAMYCTETGVSLYRKTNVNGTKGLCTISRVVVAANDEVAPRGGVDSSVGFDDRLSAVDEEDLDARCVELTPSPIEPTAPMYDLLPLARHYTNLFLRLAEIDITHHDGGRESWPDVVCESVGAVRRLFPVVLTLTNADCNVFAETFLLALSTIVRERVMNAPVPSLLVDKLLPQTWTDHLSRTLRRCFRSLAIDRDDAISRQTLFLGMVYKMTSTIKAEGRASGLCNGETVVLTSMVFEDDTLDSMVGVVIRKLERDRDEDVVVHTGHNTNRMTGAEKTGVMPFVPHVSENIYQMQGNTIARGADTFVDLANASCNNAYVGISRFQDSSSIRGIVVAT